MAGGTPVPQSIRVRGRTSECALLDDMVDAVRGGESRTLLIHGEAGIGKTALLNYVVDSAGDMGCVRPRASNQRWNCRLRPCTSCVRHCSRPRRTPAAAARRTRDRVRPERRARAGSIPRRTGGPDPAVRGSREASAPLYRRRRAVAGRRVGEDARVRRAATPCRARRPALCRPRPDRRSSRDCRSSRFSGSRTGTRVRCCARRVLSPLDERVRDRIVAETRGNPLALLELPRALSTTEPGRRFRPIGCSKDSLSARLEESFDAEWRRFRPLRDSCCSSPLPSRSGDPVLVWRAAESLGIDTGAVDTTVGC